MSICYLNIENMGSISNHQTIHFFSKEGNKDIQKKFAAALPSDFINCFISFHSIMKKAISFHILFV